jgi:hypothetical protein
MNNNLEQSYDQILERAKTAAVLIADYLLKCQRFRAETQESAVQSDLDFIKSVDGSLMPIVVKLMHEFDPDKFNKLIANRMKNADD